MDKQKTTLLKIKVVTMLLCFAAALAMPYISVRGQSDGNIPAKTMKDLQQDEHLQYDDTRIDQLNNTMSLNKQTVEQIMAKRDVTIANLQSQLNDVQEQTMAIKYFGMGAFAVLGVLQTLGLVKQLRISGRDRRSSDRET